MDSLLDRIKQHEPFQPYVIDDKTGKQLHVGMTLQGHPVIGYGVALDLSPLTEDEATLLMTNRIDAAARSVRRALPWSQYLDSVRQDVLVEMCYVAGLTGLLGYEEFLVNLKRSEFGEAAATLRKAEWHKKSPGRVGVLAALIEQGGGDVPLPEPTFNPASEFST